MLRCVDKTKDGGPGCRRRHFHQSSVRNVDEDNAVSPVVTGSLIDVDGSF
jgi:hypothetical protein